MKVLHLSFHSGTCYEMDYIASVCGFELTNQTFTDGITNTVAIYNVGHDRAANAWNKFKDYYNSFDMIITSDTAPIARTFLQNNYQGKLIIWVCNRFDYADTASLDCDFPDQEFYDLFRSKKENVKIISYTPFEHWYAKNIRNVNTWSDCIKPIGLRITNKSKFISQIPTTVNKQETFFVPPYHNDTILLNLQEKLESINIKAYNGRYNGPNDLKDFKGIIHIPYAWSNFALFENLQQEIIYFIPSKQFLLKLASNDNFFWSPTFNAEVLYLSEWYDPNHDKIFVYFDDWCDLIDKINITNYASKKEEIRKFCKTHTEDMINKWRNIINSF